MRETVLVFEGHEDSEKKAADIIQEAIVSKEADIEKVLTYNQSMLVSPWDQYSRDLFFKYIQKETVEKSMMKVEKEGLHKKIGRKWWKICRKIK